MLDRRHRRHPDQGISAEGNRSRTLKEILAHQWRVTDQGATAAADRLWRHRLRRRRAGVPVADVNIVETVAHMMSAVHFFGDVDVICDIGGQDIKVPVRGKRRHQELPSVEPVLGRQRHAAAGHGRSVRRARHQYADVAFDADLSPKFSYGCAVFLDSDRVNFQKRAIRRKSCCRVWRRCCRRTSGSTSCRSRAWPAWAASSCSRAARSTTWRRSKAQVDYIKIASPAARSTSTRTPAKRAPSARRWRPLRVVKRSGSSTFIGLDAAIDLKFTSKNDEETRCHFCPNNCARTFIDTETPDGDTSRYIAGFSCEKGTVESEEAMLELSRARKKLMKQFPNLVDYGRSSCSVTSTIRRRCPRPT